MENQPKDYSLKYLDNDNAKAEMIEKYKKEVKVCKKIICHNWFRGFCIFSKNECKYAHGISDLEYIHASQRPKQYKEHISESEVFNFKYDTRNYKILENYINQLRTMNILEKTEDFTLDELNADGKKRTKVRERFHKEITLDFMKFIFNQYPNIFLSMRFIENEFELVKYPIKYNWVFNSEYYFVNDLPVPPRCKNSFKAVFPFPENIELEKKFKIALSNIISDLKKDTTKEEITEKQITTAFYTNKAFDLPPLHILFKKLNKNLEDFFNEVQNEEEKNCYISSKEQKNKFYQEIEMCLNDDFWRQESRKKFAFSKLSDLLNYTRNHNFLVPTKEIFQSTGQYVSFIKQYLLKNNMMLIFLFSETFIINLNLLRKQNKEDFLENLKLKSIKSSKCGKSHLDWKDDYLENLQLDELIEKNIKKEKWVLFDQSRIVVVDDLESFLYSKQILLGIDKIGVDIEGQLCEGGSIDLIQMGVHFGSKRKIFVFDIHTFTKSDQKLYFEVKRFLKGLLQNNKIIKVFHDCRKDSLALHLFLDNTCPVKVYDTACIHIMIENMKLFQTISQIDDESKINEYIYKLETLLWPGLNVVLSKYEATNGINVLKEKMKKKFNDEPREFFLKRPINEEFLEYSAKDVEDLVEVFENQEKVVEELFFELNIDIKQIFVKDYLLEKMSYYYVKDGCIPSMD